MSSYVMLVALSLLIRTISVINFENIMNKTHITTKTISAQIVNGFVTGGIGGNPAGVVLDADELNENEMLRIAANIGLSETAFVS